MQGAVRRIQLAPPPAEELVLESGGSTGSTARVAVLFANGAFGVWELDQQLDLTPVRCPLRGGEGGRRNVGGGKDEGGSKRERMAGNGGNNEEDGGRRKGGLGKRKGGARESAW